MARTTANKSTTTKSTTKKIKANCLFPTCTKPAKTRGLCCNHYGNAQSLVKRGETTWDQLAAFGLIEPKKANEFVEYVRAKQSKLSKGRK